MPIIPQVILTSDASIRQLASASGSILFFRPLSIKIF